MNAPVSVFTRRRQEKLAAEETRRSFTSAKLDFQGWILCDPCLSANAKLAGIYLLSCINSETGQCNPSVQTIADEIHLSRRAVERAISEIKNARWVQAKRHDRRKSNGYVFSENIQRSKAIDDRRMMLRDARRLTRLEPPEVAGRRHFEPPEVAGLEPPEVAGKHLNRTPERDSLSEKVGISNTYALASRGF